MLAAFPLYRVTGSSMEPALSHGQLILCIRCKRLKKGDIALFRCKGRVLIKRVARVSSGGYFMTGDNAAASIDSRTFGRIPKSAVIGRMLFRLSDKKSPVSLT